MAQISDSSEERFNSFPSPDKPKTLSKWVDLIAQVANNQVKEIALDPDDSERGIRVGLGRQAKKAGITLEIRKQDNILAVRKAGEVTAPAQSEPDETTPPPPQRRRGRRAASTTPTIADAAETMTADDTEA